MGATGRTATRAVAGLAAAWERQQIQENRRIRRVWQRVERQADPSYPIHRNPREVLWVRSILFLLEVPLSIGSLHVSSTFVSACFKFALLLRCAAAGLHSLLCIGEFIVICIAFDRRRHEACDIRQPFHDQRNRGLSGGVVLCVLGDKGY